MPAPGDVVTLMIRLLDRAVGVIALAALLFAGAAAQAGEPFAFDIVDYDPNLWLLNGV